MKLAGYLDKWVPPDVSNGRVLTEPKDVVGFFLQAMTVSPCSLVPLMRVELDRDRKQALKHETRYAER